MMRAKLTDWSFHNLGPKCDKATRMKLEVVIVPACKGLDKQLFRCAAAIRAQASYMRAERLAEKAKQ